VLNALSRQRSDQFDDPDVLGLKEALQEREIGLERRVAEFWPAFAEGGKGEITLNGYKGYEVRLKGEFKNGTSSLPYWGRLILLPPGNKTDKGGVAIVMLATSNSPGVASADEVGIIGDLKVILDSFRFPAQP
jgi:hypothetical protein